MVGSVSKFDELETHQRGPRMVMRSKSPALVRQEIWGYLCCHYAIHTLMVDAALYARRSVAQGAFPLLRLVESGIGPRNTHRKRRTHRVLEFRGDHCRRPPGIDGPLRGVAQIADGRRREDDHKPYPFAVTEASLGSSSLFSAFERAPRHDSGDSK